MSATTRTVTGVAAVLAMLGAIHVQEPMLFGLALAALVVTALLP